MIVGYRPHSANGKSYDTASTAAVVAKSNIKSLAPVEVHGRQGFTVTFVAPVAFAYAPAGEAAHTQTLLTAQGPTCWTDQRRESPGYPGH